MRSLPNLCIVLLLIAASECLYTSRASAEQRPDTEQAQTLPAQVELHDAGMRRGETSVPEIVFHSGDIRLDQVSVESESAEDDFDLAAFSVEETRPVCNGKPVGYEFRSPEEVFAKLKVHSE